MHEGVQRAPGDSARSARSRQTHARSSDSVRHAPLVRLGEDRGRPALLVDGVVQSVAPAFAVGGYWAAMMPEHRPRQALLLGLGGGTIARLLVTRFGPIPIVAVDDEPAVVAVARTAFGPLPPQLQIVIADARAFVHGCVGGFDYVAVDLFHGSEIPCGVFGQPFLRAVRAALTAGGLTVFNFFLDMRVAHRLERLGRVLRVERQLRVGHNLLVHCRR